MRSINGLGILAAVIIVVAYLIAHPHVGTVWYATSDSVAAGQRLMLRSDFVPFSPPPGYSRDYPAPAALTLPSTRFIDKRDCWAALNRYENATHAKFGAYVSGGLYCAAENALLWGW